MVCRPCAHAADNRLGRDAHCTTKPGPGGRCDCQHLVERYGEQSGLTGSQEIVTTRSLRSLAR